MDGTAFWKEQNPPPILVADGDVFRPSGDVTVTVDCWSFCMMPVSLGNCHVAGTLVAVSTARGPVVIDIAAG